MAAHEPIDGERGACVLTASVAAFEGQIGQLPYASAKAGIVGLTLVAARDLASKLIRVMTIAPGTFDTPILARLPRAGAPSRSARWCPHPARLGQPDEFARLALPSSTTPCSTARRSGSTARSGCGRNERPIERRSEVLVTRQTPSWSSRSTGRRPGTPSTPRPPQAIGAAMDRLDDDDGAVRRRDHRRRRNVLRGHGPQGVPRRREAARPGPRLRRAGRAAAGEAARSQRSRGSHWPAGSRSRWPAT